MQNSGPEILPSFRAHLLALCKYMRGQNATCALNKARQEVCAGEAVEHCQAISSCSGVVTRRSFDLEINLQPPQISAV